MSWTYDGRPDLSYFSAVRFQTGDTDTNNQRLLDGEINYAIVQEPTNERLAAAWALESLASKYAAQASFSVGQISKQMGNVAQAVREQATRLRNEAGKMAMPFFGGLTHSGKDLIAQDADAVQPKFAVGQFDSPLASQFDGFEPEPSVPTR